MAKTSKIKNVLITGVTSTIGRKLAQQLYYDKNVNKLIGVATGEKPYYFDDFDEHRFHYMQTNITRPRDLTNLFLSDTFKQAEINTVVHLAFQSGPELTDQAIHTLNVEGTKMLLDKCVKDGQITKFLFKSSSVVYKVRPYNSVLLDEDSDINFDPDVPPWIKDRVDADMLCRAKMDNPKMNIIVLRVSNIIGRNVSSQLNEFFKLPVAFTVAGYDPMVNVIHTNDVINALQRSMHIKTRGVFNIGGLETAPLSKFLELNKTKTVSLPSPLISPINSIQRKLGMTHFVYATDASRMKYPCLLDTSKAERVLGFKPRNHVRFG
jgi:UDP-glucose 4-epimerase